MSGFLCHAAVTTNEEYKIILKKRNRIMGILAIIGIFTEVLCYFVDKNYIHATISEHMLGVYSGVGSGLIAVSLVIILKNVRIMKHEELLKKSRIANSDERVITISALSFRIATWIMLASLYLIGLIGGLWYPILAQVLSILVMILLISYCICYWVLNKKM